MAPREAIGKKRRIAKYVKSKPLLWDPDDPNYLNRTLKDEAWTKLAVQLHISVLRLKASWCSMKRTYDKLKYHKNPISKNPRPKWPLENDLHFLKKLRKTSSTTDNPLPVLTTIPKPIEIKEDDSDAELTVTPFEITPTINILPITSDNYKHYDSSSTCSKNIISNDHCQNDMRGNISFNKSNEIASSTNNFAELCSNLNQTILQNSMSAQANADNLFFQSIQMDFLNLPEYMKRKFKAAMLNIMNDILAEVDEITARS